MNQFGSRVMRGSAVVAFLVALQACTDFSSPPPSLGRVTIRVTDAAGAGVPGIPADLLLTNNTLWRAALTTTDGTAEFGAADGGVIPQAYIVRLLLEGKPFELAPDETNNKAITVTIGATQTVTFRLVRMGGPTPPPG